MNDTLEVVKPAVRGIVVESTMHWCEEIQAKAGRLFDVFLFDLNRHVHCCEITPSAELHWYGTIYTNEFPRTDEGERERDRLEMEIMDGDRAQEPIVYMHMHHVADKAHIDLSAQSISLFDEAREDYGASEDEQEALHDAVMQAVREGVHANCPDWHSLIDAPYGQDAKR